MPEDNLKKAEMNWTQYGWVCTGSIGLGAFLSTRDSLWLNRGGVFFLAIGAILLLFGLGALLARFVPILRLPQMLLALLAVLAKRGYLISLMVLVAIGVFMVWASPTGANIRDKTEANLRYREAAESFEAGRKAYLEFGMVSFPASERSFLAALHKRPDYARAEAGMAELYSAWASVARYRGENSDAMAQKALEHSLAAIALEPQMFEAHRGLAAAFVQTENLGIAQEEAKRALELRPNDREARFWMWAAEGQKLDQAYFDSIKSDDSYDFPFALVRVGFRLAFGGRSDEAKNFFDRAEKLSRKNGKEIPLLYVGRALAFSKEASKSGSTVYKGKIDQAIGELQKAIGLDDRLKIAYSNLGSIYLKEERWSDAQDQFKQALRIDSDYLIAAYNKSIADYEMKNDTEAMDAWKEVERIATKSTPQQALAFSKLSQAFRFYLAGQAVLAAEAYREAVHVGHQLDSPMHLDSPPECVKDEILGPRGIRVLEKLLKLSGIPAH